MSEQKHIKLFEEFVNEARNLYDDYYYHGSGEKSGENILKEGYIKPAPKNKGNMSPRPDMIYLSTSLQYAMHYVVGYNYEDFIKTGKHDSDTGNTGYLFLISNRDIKNNNILPDEDGLGMLVALAIGYKVYGIKEHLPKFKKLDSDIENELLDIYYEDVDDEEYIPGDFGSLDEELKDGDYNAYAFVGKEVGKYLSNSTALKIVEEYGSHFSVKGKVKFSHAYALDKNKHDMLKSNLSNFFDVAEKVY